MGCKCKKAKRIQDALDLNTTYKSNFFSRIIQGLIFLAVLTLILPFVLIYLYINYIRLGDLQIKIPKFVNTILSKQNG